MSGDGGASVFLISPSEDSDAGGHEPLLASMRFLLHEM